MSAALNLYRQFMRHGSRFSSYNFREYAIRRAYDAFRSNSDLVEPELISKAIKIGEKELAIVKRQSQISQMYTTDKLIIEKRH
ncbi:hypothetical protein NADFUDRAFT_82101 [Nadsonia fulvescens var. elongata DSM 6958]|uniref:Complex 1 LYR protein domain-containing protein n=1 Tax=Nadsonia fulvescens var. elongata DSM 6958 TaxID=857566 RepID=A0A1E3PL87_9ASCO|nr:hypothetical protein NADFUDRAFT_82101 [Nadsonia fulvescens var. elongata DSM 6958]